MNIGFDAKRAYHNNTGLGNYSRSLVNALAAYYPEHQYYLFNPKHSTLYRPVSKNIHEIQPTGLFDKLFTTAWRSSWVKKDLVKNSIQLYHGLSHEIPVGIQKTGIRSVVTIHDLIHERYPEQYTFTDVAIYRKKFRNACENADRVIAISEQTKKDIIAFYKTPESKIRICYQSCNPEFGQAISEKEKGFVREKYELPSEFFLYVGSIIERKNLLGICKALYQLQGKLDIPLVVIGDGGSYKRQVKEYISQKNLHDRVIFLSEKNIQGSVRGNVKHSELRDLQEELFSKYDDDMNEIEPISEELKNEYEKRKRDLNNYERYEADFPAIYQSATALIYPSSFEGFGIPVLEALWSKLPVITSNLSCLPEAGGEGAYYVDPASSEEIAEAMRKIYTDKALASSMIEKGWLHAQKFTPQKHAESVMNVYKSIW